MVQWLGIGAFTSVAWIQSLVGELRSGKPCMRKQNKNKKHNNKAIFFFKVFIYLGFSLVLVAAGRPACGI